MKRLTEFFSSWPGIALVLLLGLAARLGAASFGHNYDVESYFVVAKIMAAGGNVYAETTRYNYGPVWFLILHGLDLLAQHNETILRWLVAGFLSLADVGLFVLIYRQAGPLLGALFFLNPVSILITGFHSQFDNFALGIGLLGVLQLGHEPERPLGRREFGGLLLLGLSLATKHILFVFPLWLAVKRRGWLTKILIIGVPVAVFLASFLPWWADSHGGIVKNVFLYNSGGYGVFYSLMLPEIARLVLSSRGYWYLLLIVFAFICRPKSNFHSFLIYTGVLVAASPAYANQYLAIPAALAVVCLNPFFAGFLLLGVWHLAVDVNGLHLLNYYSPCHDLATYCLTLGIIWHLWPQIFIRPFAYIRREVNFQLGLDK